MFRKVSIIIPCYNGTIFLKETIQSALHQIYPNIEIIIIDDGSTDKETLSILNDLKNNPSLRIIHQENRGLSSARNSGIARAEGEYICCLDDDDRITEKYIQECVDVLEKNPDVGFVYSDVQIFGDYEKIWKTGVFDSYHLLHHNYIPVSAVFRKKCWEEVRGYHAVMDSGYEDWDFWLGLVENKWRGMKIPGVFFQHRKHGKTMTHRARSFYRTLYKRIQSNHKKLFVKENIHILHVQSILNGWEKFFIQCVHSFRMLTSIADWKISLRVRIKIWRAKIIIQNFFYHIDSLRRLADRGNDRREGWRNKKRNEADKYESDNNSFKKKQSPLVSVVVPVYNHASYLSECIESILSQTYDLFELILVNDDPNNIEIKKILEIYTLHSKIKIIVNEKNFGISESLNKGILQSKGDYIAFVDCDDFLPQNALQRISECIKVSPQKYYISTQLIDVDEYGKIISKRPRPQQPQDLSRGMYAGHLKIIKREVFDKIGLFNSEYDGCQDYEFASRVQEKYPIFFLQEYLYYYRWHEKNHSFTREKKQKELTQRIQGIVHRFPPSRE